MKAVEENQEEKPKEVVIMAFDKKGAYLVWEEGYHGVVILTKEFYHTKVDYIHLNPVRAGIVEKEEEYSWSSCADFFGTKKGLLELEEF